MAGDEEFRAQLRVSFQAELQEYLQTINQGLLALEQTPVPADRLPALLDPIFRAAHSLKGAARTVGIRPVAQLAHALEDVLDRLRHQALELKPELFSACYRLLDLIQLLQAEESAETTPEMAAALAALEPFRVGSARPGIAPETPRPVDPPAASVPPAAPAPRETPAATKSEPRPQEKNRSGLPAADAGDTIRVPVTKLDALMGQLSELLITKIRIEQRLEQLQELETRLEAWEKNTLAVQNTYQRLIRQSTAEGGQTAWELGQLLNYLDDNRNQLHSVNGMVGQLAREYANDTLQMSLVIDELEEEIKRVRMLPLSTILGPFGRMVRDLAYEAGKEALLQVSGAETELDKRILEQIKDPLLHLLRNAVDHGIEKPEERLARGKPRYGTLTLSAEQIGQEVVIRVGDDGQGLDLEAIRRVVARHRPEEAAAMGPAELEDTIFNPGISTSPTITDISGRGVGLDVVRRNVEALRGTITLEWQPDRGTVFVLTLPLALSNTRGLLVGAADQRFAIPMHHIERMLPLDWQAVDPLSGYDALNYQGQHIPLARLADVLELPGRGSPRDEAAPPIVVLTAGGQRAAFIVDELTGEQEIVNKGLGKAIERIGGLAGATVLGNGEIVLVLHVVDLIHMALHGGQRPMRQAAETSGSGSPAHRQPRLLIVDDSITTRALEKNILEAAGYRVRLATNGQEAWDLIASGELPDLIISDVSMPRMDGIALTRRIKGDPRTTNLPVILVTSLDSPQDKARGIEAGADAYISKGAFDQGNLLSTVEQLI